MASTTISTGNDAVAGSIQKIPINRAAPAIHSTQVRWARPPKYLSVAQPATSMPMMPNISNTATVQPALASDRPRASFRNVGPQSRTENRTIYTKKLATPSIHISGLQNTLRRSSCLYSSALPSLASVETSVPGNSDKPTDFGVSRSVINNPTAPANAIIAGIQKHHLHAS